MRKVILVGTAVVTLSSCALLASCNGLLPGSDHDTDDGGLPTVEAGPANVDATDAADAIDAADAAQAVDAAAPCGDSSALCNGTCFEGVCGGNQIVQVSAGVGTACALTKAGSLWCWGTNEMGQLGVTPPPNLPADGTELPPGYCDFEIAGCLVACNPVPTEIQGLHDVIQVGAGNGSTCAVEKGGSVWCWGANERGTLGHATSLDHSYCGEPNYTSLCNVKPLQVAGSFSASDGGVSASDGGFSASMVSMELSNACAVTTSGGVACWGLDGEGELGDGLLTGPPTPAVIPGLTGIVKVSVYGSETCALGVDGSVSCWGGPTNNLSVGHSPGTHGDVECGSDSSPDSGPTFCAPSPTLVYSEGDVTPEFGTAIDGTVQAATDIGHGQSDSCAVMGGYVYCWGTDGSGIVGPPTGPAGGDSYYPVALPSIEGAIGVSVAIDHACAVQGGDGGVMCWGQDEWGELGVGYQQADAGLCTDTVGCIMPTAVYGLSHVIQVSASFSYTVALKSDGTVWAWGINDTGRLGHKPGTGGDQKCNQSADGQFVSCNPYPTQVQGLP